MKLTGLFDSDWMSKKNLIIKINRFMKLASVLSND